ncbi:putative nuclease HARBI1 [Sitophilus oryzae]|uniref:Nuclease HARBI1 n=1 Tax=Sitophilus oryzae TaxID=7048 RepID=A0A6J2YCC0_SITOR|nr:putative nuclease HARBI1 [Sitophilus oryzae]
MDRDFDMIYNVNRDIVDLELIINIPRRYIRDMENPIEKYNDVEFRKRFRFSKPIVQHILLPIVEDQEQTTNRGLPVPPIIGLLVTLRFYATGSFQIVCGDLRGFHQATISRVIKKVTRRISANSRQHIRFPNNLQQVQRHFQRIGNFPNVTGCIDCTHVPIINPGGLNAELFRNRKRIFSINVQAVAGPDLKIYDIVARYPGSYHDSYIFNRSSVKTRFERRQLPGYLLGDAGYPCLPYLLTPFRNPQTEGERRYNEAQIRTRNVVERLFGVLKRMFSCLRRGLANKTSTSCYIIVACAVLYNIAVTHRELMEPAEEIDDDIPAIPFHAGNYNRLGQLMRATIVRNHFQ